MIFFQHPFTLKIGQFSLSFFLINSLDVSATVVLELWVYLFKDCNGSLSCLNEYHHEQNLINQLPKPPGKRLRCKQQGYHVRLQLCKWKITLNRKTIIEQNLLL